MVEKNSGAEYLESGPFLQHRSDGLLKVVGPPHLRGDKLQVQQSSRLFDLNPTVRKPGTQRTPTHLASETGRDEKF